MGHHENILVKQAGSYVIAQYILPVKKSLYFVTRWKEVCVFQDNYLAQVLYNSLIFNICLVCIVSHTGQNVKCNKHKETLIKTKTKVCSSAGRASVSSNQLLWFFPSSIYGTKCYLTDFSTKQNKTAFGITDLQWRHKGSNCDINNSAIYDGEAPGLGYSCNTTH